MGMRISEIRLKNWTNFRLIEAQPPRQIFVIGTNAAGTSNFLDAIRLLREISDSEGAFNKL